jgi:Na+-driven multidrug efflux pump
LLIFGAAGWHGVGVSGAAWGLVMSFGIGSMVLFLYLRSGRSLVVLRLRGVPLRRDVIAELFRVGIPGLANVAITNLTVVVLTGIAVRLGRDAAIGYAMGARLEYIMNPVAFGIGTGIVAMVGTSVGAGQGTRAREAAWKGAAAIACACGCIGVFFAFFPGLWMGLFSGAETIVRAGSSYLRIAGPAYALYGLGMASYFACQGYGKVMRAVAANGARLLVASAAGLLALSVWQAGIVGFSMAVVAGFIAHAALGCAALLRVAR